VSDRTIHVALLTDERKCYSVGRFREEATSTGVTVGVFDPSHFDLLVEPTGPTTYYRNKRLAPPGAFLPRTGAETTMFARAVINQMEATAGVVVINSADSVMACRDKLRAHQMLAGAGLPSPKTVLARQPSDVSKMVRRVGGPPVVLKLLSGTHGKGVMLGRDADEIQATLETVWSLNQTLLIQEFIGHSAGRDLRVLVIGGRVIGVIQRTAKLGSFRANVHQGAEVMAVAATEEMEWLALRAAEVMGLDIAGVDLIEGPEGHLVIEVNSAPGFEGFERATGINVAAEILRYARFRAGA
jgi:ribosomal protein S6--L-glutamate ligase